MGGVEVGEGNRMVGEATATDGSGMEEETWRSGVGGLGVRRMGDG